MSGGRPGLEFDSDTEICDDTDTSKREQESPAQERKSPQSKERASSSTQTFLKGRHTNDKWVYEKVLGINNHQVPANGNHNEIAHTHTHTKT